jgi:hypothetical protein
MNSQRFTQPERLLSLAQSVAAATGEWNSSHSLDPLTAFLGEVRDALGMEVAFVSRFYGGSRVVEAANCAVETPVQMASGDADELEQTYCQLIVNDEVDAIIPDTSVHPRVASLPITRRLQIGCYISATIVLRSGFVFGTICCFSRQSRADLRAVEGSALQAVADAISTDIDRHGRLTSRMWQWGQDTTQIFGGTGQASDRH